MNSPQFQSIPWGAGPESLHRRLGAAKYPFCLYSGVGGRYSYVGANPIARLHVFPEGFRWFSAERVHESDGNPLEWLERRTVRGPERKTGDFLASGWVGFLGYEMAPLADSILPKRNLNPRELIGFLGLYDPVFVFDHHRREAGVCSWGLDEEFESEEKRARERIRSALAGLSSLSRSEAKTSGIPPLKDLRSNFSRERYEKAVRRILEYIAAGDCYQVNLSQQFQFTFDEKIDVTSLFWERARRHPVPYSAILDGGDIKTLSFSPEEFLHLCGNRIRTRPIKGTRRRAREEGEDRRILEELMASPKDQAELLMIVDLERNDLGKICRPGTVAVEDLKKAESFDYVHHLVATVQGELREGIHPVGVLRALFPGGSITGAPKKRAMEIIQELEPDPRGVYTGIIGFIDASSLACFNIAIRTLEMRNESGRFGVGGGIVAGSDPSAEYEETLTKAKFFLP
jgi:para-aminobenzoate synthetase component I